MEPLPICMPPKLPPNPKSSSSPNMAAGVASSSLLLLPSSTKAAMIVEHLVAHVIKIAEEILKHGERIPLGELTASSATRPLSWREICSEAATASTEVQAWVVVFPPLFCVQECLGGLGDLFEFLSR